MPSPREAHAAAIVDDVVYVFGGKDANGGDLGDLRALNVPGTCSLNFAWNTALIVYRLERRWYRFEKMGPAPSPRSGHVMAAVGSKVFVLGGSEGVTRKETGAEDADVVHILETSQSSHLAVAFQLMIDGITTTRTYPLP